MNTLKRVSVILMAFGILMTISGKEQNPRLGNKSNKYPFNPALKNVPPFVQEDRFQMDADPKAYDSVKDRMNNFKKMLSGTLDMEILLKPIIKPLKTIDLLYLHSSYFTTIILPEGMVIDSAIPSFVMSEKIKFSENILYIKPDNDFLNGNILITYSDGKQNYHLNIMVKNYETENCEYSSDKQQYLCSENAFGAVYAYHYEVNVDDIDILFAYSDVKRDNMKYLKENGYDAVVFNGVTYYIILDQEFGSIYYKGSKYRISRSM